MKFHVAGVEPTGPYLVTLLFSAYRLKFQSYLLLFFIILPVKSLETDFRLISGASSVTASVTISLDACSQMPSSATTAAPPVFSQDAYFFTAKNCEKNSPIGSVFASSSSGTQITYKLMFPSPVVSLNPRTGILMVSADLTGSREIAATATKLVIQASNGAATKAVVASVHLSCQEGTVGNPFENAPPSLNSEPMPNEFPTGAEFGK